MRNSGWMMLILLVGGCGSTPFTGGAGSLGSVCTRSDDCRAGLYCDFPDGRCGAGEWGICRERPQGCPAVWLPVCGCDGRLHGDACQAASGGTDVATDGRCATGDGGAQDGGVPQGCTSNADCGPEWYCARPPGSCDARGTCERRPQLCTQDYNPVCGCDGRTYSNACAAGSAGVSIRRQGECDRGRCGADRPCGAGQWCDYEPASCGQGGVSGVCRDRPSACTREYAPVCGCDGRTYGNACSAYASGTDVAHEGECALARCSRTEPCREGFVCDYEPASCGANGAVGVCRERPASCPPIGACAQICGCDGQSYCSTCEAHRAGTDVAGIGPCTAGETCSPDRPCGAGKFCDYADGTCGGIGVCREAPGDCPTDGAPVCGCDGRTYRNACIANASGVDVAAPGACPTRSCASSADCLQGEWCDFPENTCGGAGLCRTRPEACIEIYAPVCGCDGRTYPNECYAQAAGVDVGSAGTCERRRCSRTEPCPEGFACDYAQNTCGAGGDVGLCRERPSVCPLFCEVGRCGCDGRPYCNECEAWAAGTDLAPAGTTCSGDTRCGPDRPCPSGQFCDYPPGTCGGAGTCRDRPQACIDLWDPVCGCDGRTYSNACEANARGVDVLRDGECQARCGGIIARVCPEGQYCDFTPNHCGSGDQEGVCRERPRVCPLYLVCMPVCGCDGRTYCNECEAASAGTDISHEGACETSSQECTLDRPCQEGSVCHWAGTCGEGGEVGKCLERPSVCPAGVPCRPVCGCNGITYCSACEAWQAGTDVRYRGRCDATGQFCGGILGTPCPDGYYCDFPRNTCGVADEGGTCQVLPQVCPLYYDPVCGCDGQTYSNECEAHAAGVDISARGLCPP